MTFDKNILFSVTEPTVKFIKDMDECVLVVGRGSRSLV